MDSPRIPWPVRAWDAAPHVRGHGRIARPLARRLVRPDVAYRTREGHLFRVDPGDPFQMSMLLGRYDPVLDAIVQRYAPEGSEVIDAGAHLGHLTLRLARQVGAAGRVHAFECDPRLAERLREHVALNGAGNVRVNELALLDRDEDEVTVNLTEQLGWSSVVPAVWDVTGTATVRAVTLDRYSASTGLDPACLSLVKLDVEGAELAALRGMRETLARSRAALLVEYIPWRMKALGDDPEEMPRLLAELGYGPPRPVGGDDVLFLER